MSDEQKTGYDPANQSPAEGQSQPIPDAAHGKAPNVDPAAKPEPVIRRGDPIPIQAGTAGFSITRDGIAMDEVRLSPPANIDDD